MHCLAPSFSLASSREDKLQVNANGSVKANLTQQHPTTIELPQVLETAVPVVKLDVESISDVTAARLATSLLGHVLFLKNQVPFPVMQLGRLPGGKSTSKATKQRAELLASFDTLVSHLSTTFTALSTAFALCSNGQTLSDKTATVGSGQSSSERAYLAILVGPSLGSAKSKVFLALDRLETRVWGQRHDGNENVHPEDDSEDEEDEEDSNGQDDEQSSDLASDEEEPQESDEEDGQSSEEDEDEESDGPDVEAKRLRSPHPPYISQAEEQRFLQNAERLLSRTLAAADADGYGLGPEISPTQTHILIRAPRRFLHPAWIPRQNVTSSMETSLNDFLLESGLKMQDDPPMKKAKKGKPQGVWITSRDGISITAPSNQTSGLDDDEMIWWSWDGKILGFADW